MEKTLTKDKLNKFCLEQGAEIFGIADITSLKKEVHLSENILKNLDRAIVLGIGLSQPILEEIDNQPTKLYFHHYRTLNMFLDQLALRTANFLQKYGFLSLPIPASQILDWEKQTSHLSHKKIGHLAGLGWMGKNNLLVSPKLGSQFRLVSILTNAPFKTDKPIKKDCGNCKICISACPAGAIKEGREDFDYLKCYAMLKDFQKKRIVDQYICGICVKSCLPKH